MRNYQEAVSRGYGCWLLLAAFFLDLFFNPEDGNDVFLRNVYRLLTNFKASHPRR
jgi:hypothetical protein